MGAERFQCGLRLAAGIRTPFEETTGEIVRHDQDSSITSEPRPVNKIIFYSPAMGRVSLLRFCQRACFSVAPERRAVRKRDSGATSSRRLLRPEPPNGRPFPLFDPRCAVAVREHSILPSVAFRSDVLHPKIKVVSFICVLDKEVLKSVLPVCRGERLFTDSAMEQATWKS